MNFLKALEYMLKGKKVYNSEIKRKNHIIYIDEDGLLMCEICNKSKEITIDMIKSTKWKIYKKRK
jgi:hypothetical protein